MTKRFRALLALLTILAMAGCGGGGGGSPDVGPTSPTSAPISPSTPAPATLPLPTPPAPSRAGIGGALGSGDLTATLSPTSIRHVITSIEPAQVEPGQAMSGRMVVTDTFQGTGTECNPPPPIEQTSTFTTGWPFHKVPAGYNFWTASDAGVLEGVSIRISGTQRQTQTQLCGPARFIQTDQIDFQISAADTANLAPGCYHLSFVNQGLVSPANAQGTIAAFTVGSGSCGEELILSVAFAYTGSLGAGGGALAGLDRATATGPGAARVGKICVRADWTATAVLAAPTTIPIEWNGQVFPFAEPPGSDIFWTGITREGPQVAVEGGTVNWQPGTYSETVRTERCVPGTQVDLPLAPFILATPGEMNGMEQRAAVLAYDSNGTLLGSTVTEPAKDDTVTVVDLQGAAAVSVTMP